MSDQKKYTLSEFVAQAKTDLDDYQKDWEDPKKSNDYHQGQHTWSEWWRTFHGFFNWEER